MAVILIHGSGVSQEVALVNGEDLHEQTFFITSVARSLKLLQFQSWKTRTPFWSHVQKACLGLVQFRTSAHLSYSPTFGIRRPRFCWEYSECPAGTLAHPNTHLQTLHTHTRACACAEHLEMLKAVSFGTVEQRKEKRERKHEEAVWEGVLVN